MKLLSVPGPVLVLFFAVAGLRSGFGQAADWTEVPWRDPQVRYLLADLTLNGGNTTLYRKFATEERDPDSREAIRLWDAGARVINPGEFERRWVTNRHGREGRVLRIVLRGTDRTIVGTEVLLSTDRDLDQAIVREVLGHLTLGARRDGFEPRARKEPSVAEALRRYDAGVRASNTNAFERETGRRPRLVHRGTSARFDPGLIRLVTDVPYPEVNVRYFMADIALGGSIEFYRAAAERDHEMGCLEAVRRTEDGYRILNLAEFERQRIDGRVVITRKGSRDRIRGMEIQLSSDPP